MKNKPQYFECKRKFNRSERGKKYRKEYAKNRYHRDEQFRRLSILRAQLTSSLRHGYMFKYLGCTMDKFKKYLEKQFQDGMTWDNYGRASIGDNRKWNIDHKESLQNFNLTDIVQVYIAMHYTNTQPMWVAENSRKSNR